MEIKGVLRPSTIRKLLNSSKLAYKTRIWRRIVFSAENKFNLDGPDGYQYYWHDVRNDHELFSKRASGGGSVMVWAGMNYFGKTEIAFLEGRQNSECYTKTLDGYLTPFLEYLRENHGISRPIFQQDNASIHESRFTKAHIEALGIRKLKWPAKSPDLNPIENVWGQLAWSVYEGGRQFDSKEELKAQITRSWNNIKQNYLRHLVEGMPTRMAHVVLKNGGPIDK
ncbi:unnamed protein product [Phytophthora fragariaefolia]|uniref:Unnamed protein product n=1 Tax=Phytophthora fragariaefolia TaxID=1490495 RepID=A0A9W7D267_9STRA|nr:unnamed protein product [Phytophthora fragariaefolia]